MAPQHLVGASLSALFCNFITAEAAPVVTTPLGLLQGTIDGPAEAFLGVRYAQQPERFEKAEADRTPWSGMRSAEHHAPVCWAPSDAPCVSSKPDVDCKSQNAGSMSEDCLFLDIWRPLGTSNTSKPKSVMVWIHGGGFTVGDSSDHTGPFLAAKQDVIVVSVNYRLGPLGFLSLWDFGTPGHGSGSMNGLHDQIIALEWINSMIPSFGGDVGSITLFGCSAGGLSTCTLSLSPIASGLFQRAIFQSGPCLGPWGPGSHEEGKQVAARVMAQLGVSSVAELRALPPWKLQWAQGVDQYDVEFPGFWVDGWVAPEAPALRIQKGVFWNPTSILLGGTSRDGVVASYVPTLPTNDSMYFPSMNDHWRPYNESGGIQPTVRTLPRAAGPEVAAAYPLERFEQHGGGAAGAFKAADGDYNVVCPAAKIAELATTAGIPTFLYYFTHGPWHQSGCSKPSTGHNVVVGGWATHGAEQDFVFGESKQSDTCAFDPSEEELSNMLQSFWAAFAKTGVPLAPNASEDASSLHWPRYTADRGAALRLETGIQMAPITNFGMQLALQAGETVDCRFWFNLTSSYSSSQSSSAMLEEPLVNV